MNGPMLNAYPDSIGGNLSECIKLLNHSLLNGVFTDFYILPSIFNSDLDRGFSIISYDLNESLANAMNLIDLKKMGVGLKLDFVLNHASVLSEQFQDILEKGKASEYKDFFIDWNKFWEGYGDLVDGYIQPYPEHIKDMHFRKPGMPLLMVPMPDGTEKPYWNTFYQEVKIENSHRSFLGQMDLNVKSPRVWEFYEDTLKKLAEYGSKIVRLDAFAYASKEPGARNFMNDPGTWDLLKRVREIATRYNLTLLPEIHSEYGGKIHEKLASEGYLIYDFFMPGLFIHAIEKHDCRYILQWINDIQEKGLKTVNMLGCHDGIPLLDLRGLIPNSEIEDIIKIIVERGGYVKDLLGSKNMYYQVNATYYSALGEDDDKMLLARALQIFMPGKPQVWYLDLFGGKNDYDAVERSGVSGHKEINRTNLTAAQAESALTNDLTIKQLELLRFRNTCAAFGEGARLTVGGNNHEMYLEWELNGNKARLDVDFKAVTYKIK
ncbi:MAG: alpha-amylase family glycosyl hydrolase [Defluviitaleaceae bacterium]|nr:alpha-amylase family glycosyl hydrolase [Defluviitaleaceae bacterium]